MKTVRVFWIIPIIFFSLPALPAPASNSDCASLLDGYRSDSSILLSYLSQLYEQRILTADDLIRFLESIRSGTLENPIRAEQAQISTAHQIHRQAIAPFLQKNLDFALLLEWGSRILKSHQKIQSERKSAEQATRPTHQLLTWGWIPGGDVLLGSPQYSTKAHLSHGFEAMTTPVTQHMWVNVMGENPSFFKQGKETLTQITSKGYSVEMQPDHPVESLTWWSALVFANRLSEVNGLPPVYDLSHIPFQPGTRAENGTLIPVGLNHYPKILAPDENIYLAMGFRLPTTVEQEYLLKAGKMASSSFPFGNGLGNELNEYAWFKQNSEAMTHSVSQKLPILIQGAHFFDLFGNVAEWSHDSHPNQPGILGGVDPIQPPANLKDIRGGGYLSDQMSLNSHARGSADPNDAVRSIGFRLVRTSHQP